MQAIKAIHTEQSKKRKEHNTVFCLWMTNPYDTTLFMSINVWYGNIKETVFPSPGESKNDLIKKATLKAQSFLEMSIQKDLFAVLEPIETHGF